MTNGYARIFPSVPQVTFQPLGADDVTLFDSALNIKSVTSILRTSLRR